MRKRCAGGREMTDDMIFGFILGAAAMAFVFVLYGAWLSYREKEPGE